MVYAEIQLINNVKAIVSNANVGALLLATIKIKMVFYKR